MNEQTTQARHEAPSSPGGRYRSSRAMAAGLYALKPAFVRRLRALEDRAVAAGVTADALTTLALSIAGVTAVALVLGSHWPLVWLAVAPLSLARMACNALDGAIARRTGTTSPRGALYNELADRVADGVTFAALAPAVGVPLALGVVAMALGTSFVAVAGAAVVGERIGGGPLGKPDRVAVLSVAAVAGAFAGSAALSVGAWVMVVLGGATIARRATAVWRRAGVRR